MAAMSMVDEIDTAKRRMANVVARLTEAQVPLPEEEMQVSVLEAAQRLGAVDLRIEILTRKGRPA